MELRDAVEADAEALATLADVPADVIRNLVHDRTVRVAERETDGVRDGPGDAAGDAADVPDDTADNSPGDAADGEPRLDEPTERADLLGFVSYDARDDVVHVTQLAGDPDACERLLAEPLGFARREGMDVELLLPLGEEDLAGAVEAAGFENVGSGPRFEGRETTRYRWRSESPNARGSEDTSPR
ncbi:MAG: hypothetical protein ABEJ74_08905 [Haloferacaceae archaeon]